MKKSLFIRPLTVILAASVLFLGGCGTTQRVGDFQVIQGERFDYQRVADVVDGTTSDNVVLDYFGEPLERRPKGNGEQWVYKFTEVKRDEQTAFLKSDSEEIKVERTLELQIEDGIVREHDFSERRTRTTESNRF